MMSRSSSTTKHQRAVGVFPNRRVTEQALYELRDSGFPMDRVSVITQDRVRDDEIAGAHVKDSVRDARGIGNKADEGATLGAATGGALGGLTGLLVGLGTLAIPGIGPILLAGATATTLATTLAGTAIGAAAGGLLGALTGLGIPEERAKVYHDRVARGEYLVIVDGTDEQIALAERILRQRGIEDYGVYAAPDAHTRDVTGHTATDPAIDHTTTAAATPVYREDVIDRGIHKKHNRHAIGIFPHRQDAEYAITDLRNAGFPLGQVALVARHFERREPFAGVDLQDRFDAARYNIPAARHRYYDERLERGDYLVIVHGNEDEINRATAILNRRNIQDWQLYEPMNTTQNHLPHAGGIHQVDPVNYTQRRAIGVFPNQQDVEYAITDLRNAGFPLNQISLVAHNLEHRDRFAEIDLHDRFDRDRFDAVRYSIPGEQVQHYNNRVEQGNYLVVVNGTEDELRQAAGMLNRRGLQDWHLYTPEDHSIVSPARPPESDRVAETHRPETHRVEAARPLDTVATGATTRTAANIASTPDLPANRQAIGVFANRQDAETAISELRQVGFPLHRATLIARHLERHEPFIGVDLRDRFDAANYGIPDNWTQYYNERVERGDYIIIVAGTETEIRQAETALNPRHIRNWETHTSSGIGDPHSGRSATHFNRR